MIRLIVISLFFHCVSAEANEVSVKAVDRAKRSVVAIVCAYQDAQTGKIKVATGLGSGFFVSRDGTFVTAGHVIASKGTLPKEIPACDLGIYVAKTGWRPKQVEVDARWFRVDDCTVNKEVDVAACRPVNNPFESKDITYSIQPMDFDETELPDGFPVAFIGFPLNSIRPMTSIGHVSAYRGAGESGPAELVVDMAGWPGVSGSPVFTEKGRAIGMIIQAGVGKGTGLAYARPSAFIRRFLTTIKVERK